uniref:P/Homo B domain-containing protein n=1 Tax=Clytia hemisphaerica TaxID=252671 RepID=A0A7M5XGB4_9CNID
MTSLKKNELINLPIKITNSNIKCLEHVSLLTSIRFAKRGQIALYLTSPSGTVTELLGYRYKDTSRRWFSRWRFTSVHFWGEKPLGKWLVQIVLNGAGNGQVRRMFIELFGSSNDETCKTFA